MITETDLSEGWKLMELKDICLKKAEYGSGAKAIDYEYKKPRYVRITDIDDNGNLKKENIVGPDLVEEKYFLEENDLLFARSGSVGKTYLYKKSDGLCQFAGYLIRFKPNSTIIDSDYLNYVVKSPHYWNWIESKKKTMTISNINAKQYSGLKIPVPPLQTQKKIVEILENAEKLKEWRVEADELADDYLKSVFLEMFGSPKDNPFEWNLVTVDDIAIKVTDGEHKTPKRSETGIKLLSARNVKNGYIDLEVGVDYVPKEEYKRIKKRCNPEMGDILISCSGTIGRVTTIQIIEPLALVRSAALIKPKNDVINPKYLEFYLRTEYMQITMQRHSKSSSQANLFTGPIKKLPVLLPPIELQNQFVEIVQQVETIKSYQSQSKQEIDNLFNTLMQKAFKGELVC